MNHNKLPTLFLVNLCILKTKGNHSQTVVSNLTKSIILILILLFGLLSCESEKKYSDYNEADFYEVQGIIDNVAQNNNLFDSPRIKNVGFTYFLDRPTPKKGIEKNIDLFELERGYSIYEIQNGYPLIVLVHKNDENISFYGQIGILDNLNPKEKKFLTEHFQNEMDKLKKKTPDYIYNALIKDKAKENQAD